MAIEKVTTPYEILVRFADDGTLQGAHIAELIRFVEDGEPIGAPTPATRPLSIAPGEGGLWDVLTEAQAVAMSQVAALTQLGQDQAARIAELETLAAAAADQLAAAEAQRAEKDQALAALQAQIDALAAPPAQDA